MVADRLLFSAAVVLALALAAGSAAPAAEEGGPPPEGAAEKGREPDRAKIKDIQRKLKAGEELTADERAFMEKNKPRAVKEGKDVRLAGEPGRGIMIEGLDVVNALDAVRLQLAQAYLGGNETGKAMEVLEKLAKGTQDKTAAGYAHLALARIYKQKNDQAKCDEELKKVTGPAVAGALAMLAGPGGETAAKLEELLKSADEPLAKALILRRLAALYAQGGNAEKLADLAERAGKLLSYKDALAAQEAEAKLQQRMGAGRPFGPMGPGGMPGMKPGMPGGPGAEGEFRKGDPRRGEDAEALKKEIKELEDAGMVEEAEALKKQLKGLDERRLNPKKAGAPREGGKPLPNEGENVF
jgi:tetratricopeptide (TPR) repeat protein